MRVAYILENLSVRGGLERVMAEKMCALAARPDLEVWLVEVYAARGDAFRLSPLVRRVRLDLRKRRGAAKVWQWLEAVRAVERAVGSIRPDVVTSGGLLGVYLTALGRYRCPVVYESHQARHTLPLPWLVWLAARRAAAVVCLTEGDAREWRGARRVEVIGNAVSAVAGPPAAVCRCTEPPLVAMLGRLEAGKGHALAIEAWREVRCRVPAARLAIYGDGSLAAALAGSAAACGGVTLHPSVGDTDAVYRRATAVLVASEAEGFSMVVAEALAHGVPVVACDVPYGPRELLCGGPAGGRARGGLLVERTPRAVADALTRVLTDGPFRRRLSQEGPSQVARFRPEAIMARWETLLAGLARTGR